MPTHQKYILVDYENVQPKGLESMGTELVKILVFAGKTQKLPSDWETRADTSFEVVRHCKTGKNAVDALIDFRLGGMFSSEPSAVFEIVSKDKGYDSLVGYMRERGMKISRRKDLPLPKVVSAAPPDPRLERVMMNLHSNAANRPKTVAKLLNAIIAWCQRQIDEAGARALIRRLEKQGCLMVSENRVTYVLTQ